MNKFMKQWKEFSEGNNQIHILDLINTIVGVVLIVSLILIFQHPENRYAILAACLSGGLMNIINGLKQMKDVKRRMTGMTFLMLGVIVIVLGFIILGL
ncbi:MAG: hypothetical protein H6Q59_3 [Firmicutes bacterium]|nr:hypothetical protein [Bacillota bacterium]